MVIVGVNCSSVVNKQDQFLELWHSVEKFTSQQLGSIAVRKREVADLGELITELHLGVTASRKIGEIGEHNPIDLEIDIDLSRGSLRWEDSLIVTTSFHTRLIAHNKKQRWDGVGDETCVLLREDRTRAGTRQINPAIIDLLDSDFDDARSWEEELPDFDTDLRQQGFETGELGEWGRNRVWTNRW